VHTITDLNEPQGSFYDAVNNRLFEANGGDGTVKIFDGATFSAFTDRDARFGRRQCPLRRPEANM